MPEQPVQTSMRYEPVATVRHESGLRTQEITGPEMATYQSHEVLLPSCCPVSGNPKEGSRFRVSYIPAAQCLEVYSLKHVVADFQGGWKGRGRYPAERNMEGMIRTLAQMCADALDTKVRAEAILVLDAGSMSVRVRAEPQP